MRHTWQLPLEASREEIAIGTKRRWYRLLNLLMVLVVLLPLMGTPAAALIQSDPIHSAYRQSIGTDSTTSTIMITRVSVDSDGTQGNGHSGAPSISVDGRYIAFESSASNLVNGDTNDQRDIFVHDWQTHQTIRVSVASDGTEADGTSGNPSISADGRYVVFESGASNLVSDDNNGVQDVFAHDRQTGQTTRVSIASDGSQGNDTSGNGANPRDSVPSISADGRFVAFVSYASNLVRGDTNECGPFGDRGAASTRPCPDIFVHDRRTGQTTRVSVASDGTQSDLASYHPTISADGRFVAFNSWATNLVDIHRHEANLDRVYLHDRETGQTTLVSVADDGRRADDYSWGADVSASGQYVTFISKAYNMTGLNSNRCEGAAGGVNCPHVYVHDRETQNTTRVSISSDGTQAMDGYSTDPSISEDGRYVAFRSHASNLVDGDTNNFCEYNQQAVNCADVFVHDRQTGQTTRVSLADGGTQGNHGSHNPSISADGRHVAFESFASNLVSGDTNERVDVFVVELALEGEPTSTPDPTPTATPTPSDAVLLPPEPRDNGEWIALVGMDRNIWLVHPDGTELRQVTTDAATKRDERGHELQVVEYSDPEWSPTGERLAFVRYDRDSGTRSLVMLELGAFGLTALSLDTLGGFDWSPSGDQIVYDRLATAVWEGIKGEWVDYDGLWVLDLVSGQESLIVSPQSEQALLRPDWAPGGSHIAFSDTFLCWEFCPLDVSVADLESDLPYASLNPDRDWSPACDWSPDGAQLACADHPGHPDIDPDPLRVLDPRGVPVFELPAPHETADYSPLWSPDGRYIAVEALVGGPIRTEYISPESFTDIVSPDGIERRRIAVGGPVDWSPDGRQMLTVNERAISAIEIDTGATIIIGEGYDADWQPQPMLPLSFDDLAVAKQAVIPRLERTHYEYIYDSAQVPIDAYNEDAAESLLMELRQAEPTEEQLAALSRLVLQEQALAETLQDYRILSNDQADIVVDVVGMSVGTLFLLGGAQIDPDGSLRGLAEKIVADYLRLVTGSIADEQDRKLARNSISLASDVISSRTGDPEAFVQALLEEQVRAMVASGNISALVRHVQPSIDQGVRSVTGSSDGETWMIEGSDAMASLQTDHISTTSQIRQETAHSQYQQLAEGLVVNEFLRDIADLVTVGTRFLPIPTILSLWTRFQQCIVDAMALSYVGNGMACIRHVSGRAGELAFQPQQRIAGCKDPTDPVSVGWLDQAAWLNLQPQLENDLTSYADAVQAVQVAVQDGDLTQLQETTDQLTAAQSNLDTSSMVALALLAPPVGETWSPATGAIAQQIVNFELDMVGLQIGLASYLADPDSQRAQDFVNLYTQRLLEGASEGQALDSWRVFLPLIARATGSAETKTVSSPSVIISDAASLLDNVTWFGQILESDVFETNAVPVSLIAHTPVELEAMVGQQVTVGVRIQNVGSATLTEATLTASTHDTVLDSLNVPSVDAGGSAELTLSFTLSAQGRSVILLELDDGARTDFRFIPLTVQVVPSQLTPTPVAEGEVGDLPESRQAGPSNRLLVATIIIVVVILMTILSAIALSRFRPANRSLTLLIGVGGPVVVILIVVILWQVGPLRKWVESSTSPPPTPNLAAPASETITATASSPIHTPAPYSTAEQSPIATPTSYSTSGRSPIATPTSSTNAPTLAAESPSGCPGAPPQQVRVGDRAYVCTGYDRLVMRAQPQRSSAEITRLESGTHIAIVDGPACAESWSWWKTKTDSGVVGWVTEGGDEVDPYFICPEE